jgi:pantetheine-phosphate adenylyltransferase
VRSVQDFEYERNIAEANKQLCGIETVLLYTRPEYAHISSSLVRELYSYHKDITPYLPPQQ